MEDSLAVIVGFVLFFLLGFGCGFAIRSWAAWLALLAPTFYALLTALFSKADGELLLKYVIALVITAAGVLAGRLLDRFLESRGVEA